MGDKVLSKERKFQVSLMLYPNDLARLIELELFVSINICIVVQFFSREIFSHSFMRLFALPCLL